MGNPDAAPFANRDDDLACWIWRRSQRTDAMPRLRGEAVDATKPMNRGLMPGRCDAYIRASLAWSSLRAYAQDHKEACDISSRSLGDIEKSHHDAVVARDNVCAGRPVRPFPADVILR
ncbi:hypothetical protein CWO91_23590 [Bradyrhizobium genosp. SA-3]|uniref:hypothetical protein n=1 Tax=Bradyrhizobium genosp. SA-3 TaxID=508868 RepID=UPI00102998BD|nr:hypothetical protein [Bradyrhizobium genosp. SA-3]RZN08226.1 hypothetical protein CWO91_23590 [Bradyrhizobium genosp. SA-3]